MTAQFSGITGFHFPDGTTQSTAAQPGIAVGQTWKNVTSDRLTNVTYRNDTLRPILIVIGRPGGNGATCDIYVDGVRAAYTSIDAYGGANSISAIVPPGSLYKNTGNTNTSLWYELR